MRKSLTYKILAAVMALSAVNVFVPHNMLAYDITSDNTTISPEETINDNIYGNGYSFTINGGTIKGDVYGVGNANYTGDVSGGNVTINGNADVTGDVNGGYSQNSSAYSNTVNISGGTIGSSAYVYGGYSESDSASGSANDNTVNISGGTVKNDVYGGNSSDGSANGNIENC